MPLCLLSEPEEAIPRSLLDALDGVDFGILLLDRGMRARYINRRFGEIWNLTPALLRHGPTFRELLDETAANASYRIVGDNLAAYIDEQEDAVRAGSSAPRVINLADRRQVLFRCSACADDGRVLTYVEISEEQQQDALDAVVRINAELRFNCELLESQGAHLAALTEAADASARQAESARLLLESEIAERRQLEAKLRRMATTDGLTGALNRAELLASAEYEMGLGHKLVVLMLDVDHFKSVNDRYGHAGGDRALQQLVAALRAEVRQIDLVGRLGGEEFAVVLPDAPLEVARLVAERLRARVAVTQIASGDRQFSVTVSIGLAAQKPSDRSIEQIMARADDALYRAKRGGRNRVIVDGDASELKALGVSKGAASQPVL